MSSCLSKVSVLRYWFVICSPCHSRAGGSSLFGAERPRCQPDALLSTPGDSRLRGNDEKKREGWKKGNDVKVRGMN